MSHGGSGGHSGGHDGSGGDSYHSGHYGHDSSGHHSHDGGVTLGSLFGLGGIDSILGHALGLDGGGHQAGHHSGGHTLPSGHDAQIPYLPVNMSQPGTLVGKLLGMRINSGFWLALFFLGFVSWLGLISFLRHHDPNAKLIFGNVNNAAEVPRATSSNLVSSQKTEIMNQKPVNMQLYGHPDPTVSADTKPTVAGASHLMWGIPVQSQNGPRIRFAVTR